MLADSALQKSCNFDQILRVFMCKFLWFSCFWLLVSCELFIPETKQKQQIVQEELKTIDWNAVDQYPLFETCDEMAPKSEQLRCFQEVLSERFSKALSDLPFQTDQDLNDTVYIDFIIDEQGYITVLPMSEEIAKRPEMIDFTTQISKRLQAVAPMQPAIKRGIPVRLRMRLPLVRNTY